MSPPKAAAGKGTPAAPPPPPPPGGGGPASAPPTVSHTGTGPVVYGYRLPDWVPPWGPRAAGYALGGLAAITVLYLFYQKFLKPCPKYCQQFICSRKTVEAIRCFPVAVPVEEVD